MLCFAFLYRHHCFNTPLFLFALTPWDQVMLLQIKKKHNDVVNSGQQIVLLRGAKKNIRKIPHPNLWSTYVSVNWSVGIIVPNWIHDAVSADAPATR
jgi:hypothetical protein